MEVFDITDGPKIEKPVATIGIFDGVHRGHKYILNSLISKAKEHGGKSVVISLWPHPRIVLNKDVWNFRLLHSPQEKAYHLGMLGLDYYVVVPFNEELAAKHACEFVDEYLIKQLNISKLILGYDNTFGRDKQGSYNGLEASARRMGLEVERLDEYRPADLNISSTAVRQALLNGGLELGKTMLDYDYYLAGEVIMGNQLGRKLGFPTANVNPQSAYKLIPKDGVYAVFVEYKGEKYPAMLNVGVRPTLDSASSVKIIEAHIFDFDLDIYGEDVIIHFIKRMRDEMKFPGMDALRKQLEKDAVNIRRYLSSIY
jgi:riboflavin kinase/FMN adenylyltransferase